MITYLKDHDLTAEVPDDITPEELQGINSNIQQLPSEELPPPQVEGQPDDVPNFFESVVKPAMAGVPGTTSLIEGAPDYNISGPNALMADLSQDTSQVFAAKAINELTFGISKPILDPAFQDAYKEHPIAATAGEMTGKLGGLMATGAVLKTVGLADLAVKGAVQGIKLGVTSAPRFIAPAIMNGATFGTHTFANETVKSFQEGNVDIAHFGWSVMRDTSLGVLMGSLSGLKDAKTAISAAFASGAMSTLIDRATHTPEQIVTESISSAAGLGYMFSKMKGGDLADATLNGVVWGLFEAVGSFGRDERLRKQTVQAMRTALTEYATIKSSQKITGRAADNVAYQIILSEAETLTGLKGKEAVDAITKDYTTTIKFFDGVNEKVIKGTVPNYTSERLALEVDKEIISMSTRQFRSEQQKVSYETSLNNAKTIIDQYKEKGALEAKIIELRDSGQIQEFTITDEFGTRTFRVTDDAIPNIAMSIRNEWGKAIAKGKSSGIIPKVRTVEEVLGASPKPTTGLGEPVQAATGPAAPTAGSPTPEEVLARTQAQKAVELPVNPELKTIIESAGGSNIRPQLDAAGQVALIQFDNPKTGNTYNLKPEEVTPENVTERLSREQELARIENPIDRKTTPSTPFSKHAEVINEIIGDLNQLESPRFTLVRDAQGNVVNRVPIQGFTPDYLKGMKPKSGRDILLLQKILDGLPVTEKDFNRAFDLLEAKGRKKETPPIRPQEETQDPERQAIQEEELGGDTSFTGYGEYASTKSGKREYGTPEDIRADLETAFAGFNDFVGFKMPELVKFNKILTGKVPVIKKMLDRALGMFKPNKRQIIINHLIFKDPELALAVVAHETFHLLDMLGKTETMKRGNILGHLAGYVKYLASLLPEKPGAPGILTDKDRARFRYEAEKLAKLAAGGQSEEADIGNQFDPQAILDIWNKVQGHDPVILDYVKGIDADKKKALIKSAMEAFKKGEKVTIDDIKKFNKEVKQDAQKVADIYKDLIKKEILKRKLWEKEVIREELINLTNTIKPFDPAGNPKYTKYRYSPAELMADLGSLILTSPRMAQRIAPNSFKLFFNYLETRPEVLKALITMQTLVHGNDIDLFNSRAKDIINMYENRDEGFIDRHNEIVKSRKDLLTKTRRIFYEKHYAIYDAEKKIKEGDPQEKDDGIYAIQESYILNSIIQPDVDDLSRLVYKPADEEGLINDVDTVLFLERVEAGDRAELANPLGFTPEEARAHLDQMKENDPERYDKVVNYAAMSREWSRNAILNTEGVEHFYSPEVLFAIKENKFYAPYAVSQHLKDWESASIHHQIGTFKDIRRPLTSFLVKTIASKIAILKNNIKLTVLSRFQKLGFEMIPRDVYIKGVFVAPQPKSVDTGIVIFKQNAKWQAVEVDKSIAELFEYPSEELGEIGMWIDLVFQNNVFKNLWITFNLGFAYGGNIFKDFLDTYQNLNQVGNFSIVDLFKAYLEATPNAKKAAKGEFDPYINQMKREGALIQTLASTILNETGEKTEIALMFQKFGVLEKPELKYGDKAVIKQIVKTLDWIRYANDVVELRGKIAANILLQKNVPQMSPKERAYYVRTFAGTPFYKAGGTGKPVTNSLWVFSNIQFQGLRRMFKAASDPKQRKGFWFVMLMLAAIPALLQQLAKRGYLGKWTQDSITGQSNYVNGNYIVIPLGMFQGGDLDGYSVALTIPLPHPMQIFHGILYRAFDDEKNFSDVLSYGADQLPSISPTPYILANWLALATGGTPKDVFRDQDILTQDELKAARPGIEKATDAFGVAGPLATGAGSSQIKGVEALTRWTFNQTGAFRFDVHERLKTEPVFKTIYDQIPILPRLIRISNYGKAELVRPEGEKVESAMAEIRLNLREKAIDFINKNKKGELDSDEFVSGITDFIQKNEASLSALGINIDNVNLEKKAKGIFKALSKGLLNDPVARELGKGISNDAQIAELRKYLTTFESQSKASDYLDTLHDADIISDKVYNDAQDILDIIPRGTKK